MAASKIRFNFWPALAILVSGVIFLAILFYILDVSAPKGWDEAMYLNRVYYDWNIFKAEGFQKLIGALHYQEPMRPPGYRIEVLPFNLMFGVHLTALRLHGLFFWMLTLWLVYGTAKMLAGVEGGAFAVIFLALSPVLAHSAQFLMTEHLLHFALALLLFVTVRMIKKGRQTFFDWILLAFSVTTGGMAKLSFFFLFGPFVLILFFLGFQNKKINPRPLFLITSAGFGGLLLLPWWASNWPDAVDYLFHTAGATDRFQFGSAFSVSKLVTWIKIVLWTVMGPASVLVTVILFAAFLLRWNKIKTEQKITVGLLIASITPMLLINYFGPNPHPRFIGPALFAFSVALAVMGQSTGWFKSGAGRLIFAALFIWQLTVMVWRTPGEPRYQKADDSKTIFLGDYTSMFRRPDQWNWEKFRTVVSEREYERPIIGMLGMGPSLSPPQITVPWAKRGIEPDIRYLWRLENGPIDWERVMQAAGECDVVLTAPGFAGNIRNKNVFDNQHNREFAERLSADNRFERPIRLNLSKHEPVDLVVFVRTRTS